VAPPQKKGTFGGPKPPKVEEGEGPKPKPKQRMVVDPKKNWLSVGGGKPPPRPPNTNVENKTPGTRSEGPALGFFCVGGLVEPVCVGQKTHPGTQSWGGPGLGGAQSWECGKTPTPKPFPDHGLHIEGGGKPKRCLQQRYVSFCVGPVFLGDKGQI